MVNARRAARDLALRALFQLDVGKQPLREVMEGALEQIRHSVDHSVGQLAHELQSELKATVEERRADLSSQSLRQARSVMRSLQAEMSSLMEEVERRTAGLVTTPGDFSPDTVRLLVERDVGGTVERMRRLAQRETLQPEMVTRLVEMAVKRASQVPTAFARNAAHAHGTAEFLHALVDGVLEKRDKIDQQVAALSEGWALDRQPAVDRNILRLAAYEVLYLPEIPAGASINEAVELAKKYSTAESGRFVNGVLGALAAAVGKEEKSTAGGASAAAATTTGHEPEIMD